MSLGSSAVDVLVVGGGFAGLACATAAAARGLEVLVLDRRPGPGVSPHTTGILTREAARAWDVPAGLTRTITGVRLHGPSLRFVDLHSPGNYFLATDTEGLLRWLAARAVTCGARLQYGQPWAGAKRAGDRLVTKDGSISTRWVVGADGARSDVAADFGLGRNREFLVGSEVGLVGVEGLDEDHLHCFLDSDLAPGYLAWAVPGCGVTQVGVACRPPSKPDVNAVLARLGQLVDLSRSRVVERRGGLIPIGGPVHPVSAEGVLLVGDAAGHVSPLTAGGIHCALELGRHAGLALAEHLLAGGPEPAGVVAELAPKFRWKQLMRHLLDLRPPNGLLDAALATRPLRAFAQTVFFHHRGLFEARAWRDAARALILGRPPSR